MNCDRPSTSEGHFLWKRGDRSSSKLEGWSSGVAPDLQVKRKLDGRVQYESVLTEPVIVVPAQVSHPWLDIPDLGPLGSKDCAIFATN